MTAWQCNLCSHIYDEAKESTNWDDLSADWVCPICGCSACNRKSHFCHTHVIRRPLTGSQVGLGQGQCQS